MPTPPTPSVLLFDLGGVLIENVTFQELPNLLPEPLDAAALFDQWLESDAVRRYERGQISTEEFGIAFVNEWKLGISPAAFLRAFSGWPKGPYQGALELLVTLKKRFRIAFLSNCNAVHWERLDEVLVHGDAAFSSHLLGMVKPDAEVFVRVIDELGLRPEQICFFDDSAKNVDAARAAGMQAYRTIGFPALQEAVAAIG